MKVLVSFSGELKYDRTNQRPCEGKWVELLNRKLWLSCKQKNSMRATVWEQLQLLSEFSSSLCGTTFDKKKGREERERERSGSKHNSLFVWAPPGRDEKDRQSEWQTQKGFFEVRCIAGTLRLPLNLPADSDGAAVWTEGGWVGALSGGGTRT